MSDNLSLTIHLLGNLLGQVISEQESSALFEAEERIRLDAKARRAGDLAAGKALSDEVAALPAGPARAISSAFALYFDLVNLAEENYRVEALRQQEADKHPEPIRESIGEAIAILKNTGVTPEQMAALLKALSIELVLTAHPTEAKRRTILSKVQRIAHLLHRMNQGAPLPREQEDIQRALHAEITAFWLTERARTARPAVTDEVRTGLYFVDSVFWNILPKLYDDLDRALAHDYPGLSLSRPWLRLASWVGGDRDGNPNVTTEVTAETLRLHRGLAVENHRRELQELARRLSMSSHLLPPPADLLGWIEARRPLPPHVTYIEKRYASEPYRLVLSLLANDLAEASQDNMTARLLAQEPALARIWPNDLTRPLNIIAKALPPALAQDELLTVRRQMEIFGLHAVRLDIREDSSRLNAALGEILRALEIAPAFEMAAPDVRLGLLTRLLAENLPMLARHPGVTGATAETWALFQLIARVREVYGTELLGPVIISMTGCAADVLTVLLLARWTGCADGLQICPLFETIGDLEAAPLILEELFACESYQTHLATCEKEQMVMIGYSDSNKDGGYLMANWALYQAQENIAKICQARDVYLTLFHGRGGTVARGGGPANRAIRSQPAGTIEGRFRLTEQGEIITSRYSNPDLAHRHLEQIVHAVLLASAPHPKSAPGQSGTVLKGGEQGDDGEIRPSWREALTRMSSAAFRAYRKLVYETPGFIDFWRTATPLDEIKHLQIGSRPATRSGGEQVSKIRAIPWVFSWMQSRYNLPGWYGLGSGLCAITDTGLLDEMYEAWPFFRTLLDNAEISLLKADMGIAALYADLVPDRDLAERLFADIRAEYDRTCVAVLAISHHQELMESDRIIQRSVALRNPYVDPLNYIQVEMLRRLRALPDPGFKDIPGGKDMPGGKEAEAIRDVIVLTINGIAAGLRNTG